jgi:hypothetical protein
MLRARHITRFGFACAMALALSPAAAQTTVSWSPLPREVAEANFGKVSSLTPWQVRIVNGGREPVTVNAIALMQHAEAHITPIEKASARRLIASRQARHWTRWIAVGSEQGGAAAAGLMASGMVTASRPWMVGVLLGIDLARQFGQLAEREFPLDFVDRFDAIALDGVYTIGPGEAVTRVVMARTQKKPAAFVSEVR